jgi:hypothetical protein
MQRMDCTEETNMSDVVGFLEKWGQDARLRYATSAGLAQEMVYAGIAPFIRKALLDGEQRRVEFLIGAQPNVCCLVALPNGDEDRKEAPRKAADEEQQKSA